MFPAFPALASVGRTPQSARTRSAASFPDEPPTQTLPTAPENLSETVRHPPGAGMRRRDHRRSGQMESDWTIARNRCTNNLAINWKSQEWRKRKRPYQTLSVYFQNFGIAVFSTFLNIAAKTVTEDEAVAKAQSVVIPTVVANLLPLFVPPNDDCFGPQILRYLTYERSFGIWEQETAASWKAHCAAVPEDVNQAMAWLLDYHLALRFPTKRNDFKMSMTQSLSSYIVSWKAQKALGRNPPTLSSERPVYFDRPDPFDFFLADGARRPDGSVEKIARSLSFGESCILHRHRYQ